MLCLCSHFLSSLEPTLSLRWTCVQTCALNARQCPARWGINARYLLEFFRYCLEIAKYLDTLVLYWAWYWIWKIWVSVLVLELSLEFWGIDIDIGILFSNSEVMVLILVLNLKILSVVINIGIIGTSIDKVLYKLSKVCIIKNVPHSGAQILASKHGSSNLQSSA